MSFGTSPISPSLLAQNNPIDAPPRGGGILLNGSGHRTSLSDPAGALDLSSTSAAASGSYPSLPLRIATPPVPGKPHSGGVEVLHAPLSGSLGGGADGVGGRGSFSGVAGGEAPASVLMGRSGSQSQSRDGEDHSPKPAHKIRFAPLPDPRRPRSLSTGRNITLGESIVDENGEETRGLVLRGMGDDDEAVDDEYDEEDDGEDGGEGGEEAGKRGRSWSKTMGSSWKGTKKLLSGKNPVKEKEKEGTYEQGAPLQKSVSTGGFVGASPFRWTLETERRRSMQGPPPESVTSLLSARRPDGPSSTSYSATPTPASPGLSPSTAAATHHRRSSSYEHTQASSLGASPTPVRMLNGRVYGSRRASEAAERERRLREKNEPAFVEWGATGLGGGNGPVSATPSGGRVPGRTSFLGDEDDGGGMAWVKRRREERLRKEQEEKEKAVRGGRVDAGGDADDDADPASSPTTTLSSTGDGSPLSGTHPNAGLSSSQSSQSSLEGPGARTNLGITTGPQTPAINVEELPPTPTIQVSYDTGVNALDGQTKPHTSSPVAQAAPSGISVALASGGAGGKADPGLGLGKQLRSPEMDGSPTTVATRDEGATEKQAMRIPSGGERSGAGGGGRVGGDPFGEEEPRGRGQEGESDSEEEDGEEEEEEEDDGDFDDDEEEEMDAVRTTSSAAGVEVISRHKN